MCVCVCVCVCGGGGGGGGGGGATLRGHIKTYHWSVSTDASMRRVLL